ncbi:MAG: WD40 repeat domain-containing protein [Planctomycetaceae bacterium]|jgi:WD40 repeat protein|nr:WD40 repeat domain-containing protein [Planctomycetaceae bacterium]
MILSPLGCVPKSETATETVTWFDVAGEVETIRPILVDAEEHYAILALPHCQNSPTSNIFSPDGKKIVMAGHSGTVQILDADSGDVLQEWTGDTDWMFTAAFSPDGKKIVSGGRYNTAQIWDAESGEELHHLEAGFVLSASFSPDGKKVATAGYGTAQIWDAESGKKLRTFDVNQHGQYMVAFSPNGTKIVTAEGLTARIWDVDSGKVLQTWQEMEERNMGTSIKCAVFSPDGKKIVTSGETAVRIWDVESGKELRRLKLQSWEPRIITGSGSEPIFESATFSPDGTKILAIHWDGIIRIWDAESGEALCRAERYSLGLRPFVAFSPDGKKIVMAGHSGTVQILDADSGDVLQEWTGVFDQ